MTTDTPTIQNNGHSAHGVETVTVHQESNNATEANADGMRVKPEEKLIPSQRVSVKITLLI